MNGESNGNVKSLSFLNYLHGSEPLSASCVVSSVFLNYLHGSERRILQVGYSIGFLNYLHGSELEHNIL